MNLIEMNIARKEFVEAYIKEKNGMILNADSNAAFNIIRKANSISKNDLLNHSRNRGLTSSCRIQVSL